MDSAGGETVFISLIHFPVFALGPGKRAGIWFQGCGIGCLGCISQHTWPVNERFKTSINKVLDHINNYRDLNPAGITISGGEPFDQPEALYSLLKALKKSGYNDILVYSGYRFSFLKKKYPHIIELVDILIDGKFEQGQETDYHWKGSENQEMIILSKKRDIMEKYLVYSQKTEKRKLQMISVNNDFIHIIGIPAQKDSREIKNGFI